MHQEPTTSASPGHNFADSNVRRCWRPTEKDPSRPCHQTHRLVFCRDVIVAVRLMYLRAPRIARTHDPGRIMIAFGIHAHTCPYARYARIRWTTSTYHHVPTHTNTDEYASATHSQSHSRGARSLGVMNGLKRMPYPLTHARMSYPATHLQHDHASAVGQTVGREVTKRGGRWHASTVRGIVQRRAWYADILGGV